MPNWCNARMAVVLPTRNVERFKDLFLGHSEEENENKDRYFARTFLNDSDEVERNDKGMSCVTVDFDCAWSVWSCMFDRTGYVDEKKCPSLQTIVKELEIQRIIGKSNEPGMGFEESITFDIQGENGITCDERDIFPDPDCEGLEIDDADNPKVVKERMEKIFGKEEKWEKNKLELS